MIINLKVVSLHFLGGGEWLEVLFVVFMYVHVCLTCRPHWGSAEDHISFNLRRVRRMMVFFLCKNIMYIL